MGDRRDKIHASSAKFDAFVEKQLRALQLRSLQEYHGSPHYYYEDYKMRQMTYFEATLARMPRHNCPPPMWKGKVVAMAMDPCDCKYLQEKIEEGNPIYVELILSEVKDYLHMLMTDPVGKDLIQRILDTRRSITWQQMDFVVFLIISNDQKLIDVCMDNHGTWVMQVMLENITRPFMKVAVVYAMKRITAALMKNFNGSHVIVQCVKLFPPELQKIILDEVARNCVDIATDKVGCSVIQKCFDYSGRTAIQLLVFRIIIYSMLLAESPYGNYVVQYVIKMEIPFANKLMIAELRGNFVRLSMNKYSSNVVEDLLRYSNKIDVDVIVEEIIKSPHILNILQDPYGNFVAQRALEYTQGHLRGKLSHLIRSYSTELHSHPYGKNVLIMAMANIL
ncbi:pumilio [Trifolium repens]|nr:pumilio [Trifolium repens]